MKIGLEELKISCIIGVLPHEREIAQEIILNVVVEVDEIREDLLEATIDYMQIAKRCQEMVVQGQFQLIETCARILLEMLVMEFKRLGVHVRVKKPSVGAFVEVEYGSCARNGRG